MIGFLCPTQAEYSALSERLGAPQPGTPGPFPATSGSLEGQAAVVCRCGIGRASAAAAAQWMLDTGELAFLPVCGAAGSLVPELKIGDIVIGQELLPADCGIWSAEGFCWTGSMAEIEVGFSLVSSYPADARLLGAASRAGKALQREEPGMRITLRRIVACDQATFSLSRRQEPAQQFSAQAVDTEGAAVAHVAMLNAIPSLVLRAISDEVCFDLSGGPRGLAQDFGAQRADLSGLHESMTKAAEHASRLATALIRHLS